MKRNTLYLASKSPSRKALLEKAGIDFKILDQDADESQCDWGLPLQKVVESIAEHKMKHVIMPQGTQGQIVFVLTADTLGIDTTGAITGKPVDMADAIAKIKAAQNGINRCGTAFCLEKKVFDAGAWKTEKKIIGYAQAAYEFYVPDSLIEEYIKRSGSLEGAGAIKVENGPQFLKSVSGSYTAIIGLPMYELWQALDDLGFPFVTCLRHSSG
jgi:septum formation protein